MEYRKQLRLFPATAEKGSSEWSAFNTVADDHSGMFRVAVPRREQPSYTNIVPIRRYRSRRLFPRPAY